MGWGSSVVKSVSRAVKKASKSVSKTVSKAAQGASNLSGTVASKTLDVATLGQKDLVNGLTGGAVTSLEGVYRGNSADIARLGATGAAFAVGGPAGAFAANNLLASGASLEQVGLAALSQYSPGLGTLASQFIKPPSSGTNPTGYIARPEQVYSGIDDSRISTKEILIAVGVAILGIFLLIFFLKKKGK